MIRIEITDPHTLPSQTLMDTAGYLMRLAGAQFKDGKVTGIATPPVGAPDKGAVMPDPKPAADVFGNQGSGNVELNAVTKEYVDGLMANAYVPPKAEEDIIPEILEKPVDRVTKAVPPPPLAGIPAPRDVPMIFDTKIDMDINMIPWDARIHSRTKSKTANGAWKLQRGVNMKLVEKVTQELYAVMELPEPAKKTAVPPPPVEGDPIAPPADPFPALITKITTAVAAGKLNQAQVLQAVNAAGIPSLPLVATRPDLVPQIAEAIDKLIS